MSAATMDASTTSNTSSPSLPEMRAEATTLLTSGRTDYIDQSLSGRALGKSSAIRGESAGDNEDSDQYNLCDTCVSFASKL